MTIMMPRGFIADGYYELVSTPHACGEFAGKAHTSSFGFSQQHDFYRHNMFRHIRTKAEPGRWRALHTPPSTPRARETTRHSL